MSTPVHRLKVGHSQTWHFRRSWTITPEWNHLLWLARKTETSSSTLEEVLDLPRWASIVLKGERVVILESQRSDVIERIHLAHQGVEKWKLRAKSCVFWPTINKDIESSVQKCEICQESQNSVAKETLQPHEVPTCLGRLLELIYSPGKEMNICWYAIITLHSPSSGKSQVDSPQEKP